MAVTFVAAGTAAAGLGAVTPGMPTGATTDDLLICHIEGEGEDTANDNMTDTVAWTLIGSVASATDGAIDRTRHSLWWAPYSAGINREVADAGDHTLAVITAWRGVNLAAPIHQQQSTIDNTNDTAGTATGVTTTLADCLIVISNTAGDDNGAGASVGFSAWTNASLANPSITEAAGGDVGTSQGSDASIGIAYGGLAAAGASGTTTWTIGASEETAAWVIALPPALPAVIGYKRSAWSSDVGILNPNLDATGDYRSRNK